jgi:hypothetical protein
VHGAEQSWRLGIHCRAKSETWHPLPSKVGDLVTIAMVLGTIKDGDLVSGEMIPSNMRGDLVPIVLVLSNRNLGEPS